MSIFQTANLFFREHWFFIFASLGVVLATVLLVALFLLMRNRFFPSAYTRNKKVLYVGFPIFSEKEHSPVLYKSFCGFMSDVLTRVASHLKQTMEIKKIPVKKLNSALKSEDVDIVVMDSQLVLESNVKGIDMVPCYTTSLSSLVLLFWDRMPQHIASLDDYSLYPNNTTVVLKDSLEEHHLAQFPSVRVRRVATLTQLIVELKIGIVRSALVRFEHAYGLKREYPTLKMLPITLDKRCIVQDEKLGILSKNHDLIAQVEHKMAHLRRTHVIEQLHHKWFSTH